METECFLKWINLNKTEAAHLYNRYDKCQCLATACRCRHADVSGLVATSSNQQTLLCTFQDGRDHLLLYCRKVEPLLNQFSEFVHACQSLKIAEINVTREKVLNSVTDKFSNKSCRNLWNISKRNQVAFYVSMNHVRLSEPLGQHSVNLSTHKYDILEPVKIALSINNKCRNKKVPSVQVYSQILPEL